jgi:PAS domain S-box-containing protein
MMRLALADTEGARVIEAVIGIISTEPDRRATPVLDSDATRAKLELLGSRVTGFEISGWGSATTRIALRQSLPAETRLPAQSETLHWAELLDCSSLEEAVVFAQQRGKLLAAELSYARAHQQTPAAIAASAADRDDLETLSVVVSRASNAILIMDAEGMIHWVNDAFTSLSGYRQTDVSGKRLDELLFGPSTSSDSVREFHQALQNGHELTQDLLQYHRDGRTCWVECRLIPVNDEDGKLSRWIALERDITRHRQTEEALLSAKQSAEDSSRAKSEFLANMSHEIRTPLNAILGMTELCLTTELTHDQQEYLSTVQSSADTLLQLLNDILDLSKIEAGKMEIEETDFNLAEVVRETLRALAVRAHEKRLELAVHMPMDMPQWMRGDPIRLRQVLFNLVGNAIKFTERGEVVVEVEEQWSGEDEVGLHFSIRDTGIGIPAQRLEQIFESFTQVDSSMARKFGGTGLGLTITSQLLKLMNGRIWVRSKEGQGSTFHFTVRLKLGRPQQKLAVDVVDLKGKRALIVDDNATNRRILDEMLKHLGVVTTQADSAESAVRKLESATQSDKRFDIVLLDAMMPRIDGFQLAEAMNERDNLRADTVMMLSSVDRPNSAARCRDLGIAGYLVKPVSANGLIEALLKALGGDTPRTTAEPVAPNGKSTRPLTQTASPSKSLRILVADDHEPNRELAVEILRRRGHDCFPVADGDKAIEAFEREAFDLILMDVQMPSLDGLTATRRIRQLERKAGGRTPIIALTAHALAGDREKCLAAGMDAYLAKPLHARELVALVEKIGGVSDVTEEELSQRPTALRKAGFDFSAALDRMGGETDLLYDHMNYVLNDAPELLERMREALTTENARQLEISAHRLKSLVSSYNHDEARDLAIELEQMGKDAALDQADRSLSRLSSLVEGLNNAIRNYMRQQKNG